MENTTGLFGIDMADVFSYLVALEDLTQNKNKVISKHDYEKFLNEFLFNKLKGEAFGEAFCKRFGFNDVFLKGLSDNTAKHHIEKLGYIKDDTLSN